LREVSRAQDTAGTCASTSEDISMSDAPASLNAALAGRYRIERELGEGGMATVYLAHDMKHDRKVALKVLKPELAAVVGAERFLAEIRMTASLQHPHILPLFDSGEADELLYYVMPHVEGRASGAVWTGSTSFRWRRRCGSRSPSRTPWTTRTGAA
jgi:serine/threonine protein kinase